MNIITQHKVFFNGESVTKWREGKGYKRSDQTPKDEIVAVYPDEVTIEHRQFILVDDVSKIIQEEIEKTSNLLAKESFSDKELRSFVEGKKNTLKNFKERFELLVTPIPGV